MDEMYLIESMEHTHGSNRVWWAPDSKGYTCNIDKAGRYTLHEATRICVGAGPKNERMWKEADAVAATIRVVLV